MNFVPRKNHVKFLSSSSSSVREYKTYSAGGESEQGLPCSVAGVTERKPSGSSAWCVSVLSL